MPAGSYFTALQPSHLAHIPGETGFCDTLRGRNGDCFGLPFRNKVMQPCWQITFHSKSSWFSQAIYNPVGFEWNLWLRFALVQLLSFRRSKTASRLMLATQESLVLSPSVRSDTAIVSETQTERSLPFVHPHQRALREFAVICFVDFGEEASAVCEGLPRSTYKGYWLRKMKIRQQRVRTQVVE